MKKIYLTIFTILIIILSSINIVYADPGSSRGFADFGDEEADQEAKQLEKEQEQEQKNIENKSSNNYLKSLKIEGFNIEPSFDKDIQEYTIKETIEQDKIKITAVPSDSKATLTGIGEVQTNGNEIRIDVTAESGTVRTYIIKYEKSQNANDEEKEDKVEEVEEIIEDEKNTIKETKEIAKNNTTNKDNKTYLVLGIVLIIVIVILIILMNKRSLKKGRYSKK